MGYHTNYQRVSQKKPVINPIWRGIGCILIVVVPLITYALTVIFIPTVLATGMIPPELTRHVDFPLWVYRTPFLDVIATFIRGINNLWLGVIMFIVILLLLTGISSLIYVSVLQVIGPPRYTEMDAPPPKYKAKPYKR